MNKMKLRKRHTQMFVWLLCTLGMEDPHATAAPGIGPPGLERRARDEIELLQAEKISRTPAQRKIDSHLLQLSRQRQGMPMAPGLAHLRVEVPVAEDGRVLVDIKAVVSAPLLRSIEHGGGRVLSSFPGHRAIRALVPVDLAEILAARPEVRFIRPADQAMTQTGPLNSQGDVTHRAAEARGTFGVNGAGIKVGVLSDSVDHLANSQANGELPTVHVLPGQAGQAIGEGTAMLEIVHDLAPGAELYFATAIGGTASFAQNIRDLYAAGCRIIVDDIIYFSESPFQASPIAQAVAEVTAGGALYFWSAGNSGNKNDNTSGTWEGDFVDGGTATIGRGGRLHDFGNGTTFNTVTPGGGFQRVDLYWSDPLEASANDYDVYVLGANGAVVRSSTNVQDGDDDPYEFIFTLNVGERIVIVKFSGEDRYLHLSTVRGRLAINTSGSVRGHAAITSENFMSVAATWVRLPALPFVGGSANPVETFSSDGPRRMFFHPDGQAATPGNFSSSGGLLLQAPSITAADGVSTSVPFFSSFFGTSAAAPHAAAIAALIWSYNSTLSPAQIRAALVDTALDTEDPGTDRDSGAGIITALGALEAAEPPSPRLAFNSTILVDANSNASMDPNECAEVFVRVGNLISPRGLAATGVSGRLISRTAGLIADPAPQPFDDVPPSGIATNRFAFQLSATEALVCSTAMQLELVISGANAGPFSLPFTLNSTNAGVGSEATFESASMPMPIPDLGIAESPVTVSGVLLPLGRVTVEVHLTHTYNADLTLALVAPDGSEVELSSNNGGSSANYGVNCSARTVFDDAATNNIALAVPPFAGVFQPEGRLSILHGKVGTAVNGVWKLRVTDRAEQDTGVLQCWALRLTPVVCFDGGGQCLIPPLITSQPQTQTVTNGHTIQFEVVAQGTPPLNYQWHVNGTNRLQDATNRVLVLPNVAVNQAGAYSVVVSNRYGTTTSVEAVLSVVIAPSIAEQPQDLTVTNGQTAVFFVVALGSSPLALQWHRDDQPLPEATGPTLILSNVQPGQAGSYSAIVSNPYGTVSSRAAQLIIVQPPTITGQPQNQMALVGETMIFSVVANGSPPLDYQWFFNETNPLVGATNTTLLLSDVQTSQSGGYSVVVRNAYGQVVSIEAAGVVRRPNSAPSVTLLSPADGSSFATDQGPLIISAQANDGDGRVTFVELIADGVELAERTGIPYQFEWLDPSPGTHRLWAVAVDDSGARATSSVAMVTVHRGETPTAQIISTGAVWKYWDTGEDQGTNWRSLAFDDGAWPDGPAELGYGDDDDGWPEATVIRFGTNANDKIPTYYFRRGFVLTDAESFADLQIRLLRDDGAVVYLNGVEVFRSNMPAGAIAFASFATGTIPRADETNFFTTTINPRLLLNGANVVAVEVHQANRTSSDLSFDLALPGQRFFAPRISRQPEDLAITNSHTAIFRVSAAGPEPFSYQWFFNGSQALPQATNDTLIVSNVSPAHVGNYSVVVSNAYGGVSSRSALLTILQPNEGPSITLTTPSDGETFSVHQAPIVLAANATDPDGRVASVAFFVDGGQLTITSAHPYEFHWLDAAPGLHSLWAEAIDDDGARQTSEAVTISVTATNVAAVSLLSTGTVWKYLDTGIAQGTAWRTIQFDDSSWAAGPAELGYGDAQQARPEATVISFGPDADNKIPTYYFRRAFVLSDADSFRDLSLNLLRDDGAIVYLNGSEVFRSNMPGGAIDFQTFAANVVSGAAEATYLDASLVASILRDGTNLVAVELHQANADSSDVSFDLALKGTRSFPPTIVSQPRSLIVTNGDTIMLLVFASGIEPLSYRWHFQDTPIQGATESTLTISNATRNHAGSYFVSVSNAFGGVVSEIVTVQVLGAAGNEAPSVTLDSPVDRQIFELGEVILLAASAGDPDGQVVQVKFYDNGAFVGEAVESPYEFRWNGTLLGGHSLWAVATDNLGVSSTSQVIRVAVALPDVTHLSLVSTGAIWRYLDTGIDQGMAWLEAGFNDGGWREGAAELGYGDTDQDRPEATIIRFGEDPLDKFITYYFRRTFVLTNAASFGRIQFGLLRDDGAVVYLNGIEVFRSNMPDDPITFGTTASSSVSGQQEIAYFQIETNASFLVDGTNLLAVEVHQASPVSSDISFDLALMGARLNPPTIITHPVSITVSNGATVLFTVEATGAGGITYQWFFNGTNQLPAGTNATLTLRNVSADDGGVYAIAVRNPGGMTWSEAASLTVLVPPPNEPPVVRIDSPAGGEVFRSTAVIALVAQATDTDGQIEKVEFLAGEMLVGEVTTPPFAFDWIGAPIGIHELRAGATDNDGARTLSDPIMITVVPPPPPPSLTVTLVSTGAIWKYLDTGVDQGAIWRMPEFDDSAWAMGPAELGYGDIPEGRPEATQIGFGPDPENKFPAYYFRHSFEVSNATAITSTLLRVLRDDGAIVYLNGTEVFRSNLPEGDISFTNLALVQVEKDEETIFITTNLPPSLLVLGTNVLAAEVHQVNGTNSDISFSLELSAEQLNAPVIVAQPQRQEVRVGETAHFTVIAQGVPPLYYQWFHNGLNSVAGASEATLTLTQVQPANEGSYFVVVSNDVGSVTSEPALLGLLVPPAIIIEPPDVSGVLGGTVELTVMATGSLPLSYHWFFQETNLLAGASNGTLRIIDAQASDAGRYHVIVSNAFGSVTSRLANVFLGELPIILAHPLSQTIASGGMAQFFALADGAAPLSYQWLFNETNALQGATNHTLTLTNVSWVHSGGYRLEVSNEIGSVSSDPAILRVLVSPLILSITRSNTSATLSLESTLDLRYSIEARNDVDTGLWSLVPGAIKFRGTGEAITLTDSNATNAIRFYRILVE